MPNQTLNSLSIVFIQLIHSGWGQEMKANSAKTMFHKDNHIPTLCFYIQCYSHHAVKEPLIKHIFIIIEIIYDIPQNVDAILTLFTLMFASNISRQFTCYTIPRLALHRH